MSSLNGFSILILISFHLVNSEPNCSTYNPCGSNAYCRDNSDGEWSCECKFWWNGTLCNEQTNSGKQIIILGCLLGFLLIVFYGLNIFHAIRERRKKPKEKKQKKISQDPKLVDLGLKQARRSARLSSCIIAVLMAIVAGVALVGKWAIIQPIHNEIVFKYQHNQSIYYKQNSFCDTLKLSDFNIITFPVACFLILVFIIRTKRTSLLRNFCFGYGAPPMPVDFISHIDRKFTAVIFAICADELLYIMQQAFGGSSKSSANDGIIVVYLKRLFEVLIMGFRYYPLLAAVYINSIVSLTLATLYSWLDYSITIVNQGMCKSDFYPTYEDFMENNNTDSIDRLFDYYGTGNSLIAIQLCTDIPRFLCISYIVVKLPVLLITTIYNRCRKDIPLEKQIYMKLTREQRIFFRISSPNSPQVLYVRNLFRSAKNRPRTKLLIGRLIPKFIYEWRDDFCFSTRVLSVYSSIFLLLYYVAIQACIRILPYLNSFQKTLQELVDAIANVLYPTTSNDNTEVNSNTSNFPIPSLQRAYLFALLLTMIIIILQLLVLLANMRRNLFQSFRGDDTELPRRHKSRNVSYATGNIHFAGYFIGYLIWGFIIIAVFAVIICVAIDSFIVFGSVRLVEMILKAIIPSLLFIFFKQYLNRLLAKYVFLQHRGAVPSLNNRRILMIFIFFNFFLDAFLGFISSIIRLIKSVIGGIIYMCRLDYSPFGRKLETMDGGFSAYCGFIYTECAHRHPVMLVFVSYLYTQVKMKQLKAEYMDRRESIKGEKYLIYIKPSSKYVQKWKLAVFLLRNPTIVFYRKSFLSQLRTEEVHALNSLDHHDKANMQQKLAAYSRRMSLGQISIHSENLASYYDERRF